MTRLVPDVLTPAVLSVAELSALRLDGEAFPLGDSLIVADAPVTAWHRAMALAALVGPKLVVERESALWVHGHLLVAPAVHTVCLRRDRRTRVGTPRRLIVRETNVLESELVRIAGIAVTTPARTLVDLALHPESPRTEVLEAVARLVATQPGAHAEAVVLADAAHYTPGRIEALRRLAAWAVPPARPRKATPTDAC